jgi:hypothetical protein
VDEMEKSLEQWKGQVLPALQSKKEEFHLLGYESVTREEIWKCVLEQGRRSKQEQWFLHQVVNIILTLSVNKFMNWLTISAFKSDLNLKDIPFEYGRKSFEA